ncbi:MAG: replication-relaxation family protein [Anaerolineae bacterium]
MRFQTRDGEILSAIYYHDGILARRHLKARFWPTSTLRAGQKRLGKLVDNDYLARPTAEHRRVHPVPEPIYWLGWRGIIWIAGQQNVTVVPPANAGENQLRKLAKQIRNGGLHWLREPRWNQLAHDLAVIDFQLDVERDISTLPHLILETWQHEGIFRADGDVITYRIANRTGQMRKMERRIYPDSYFVIINHQRSKKGSFARARLLLELDNATHTNARFGREKVVPGLAYIRSKAYRMRFGDNSGRWLIVTTGATRMRHLMQQTQQVAGAGAGTFLFTTMEWLKNVNVLTDPVWHQVKQEQPVALFTSR